MRPQPVFDTLSNLHQAIEHLSRDDRYEAYNDPRQWFRTLNPPSFSLQRAGFQKKIDKIVGMSARSQSIIMLKWAWECSYLMFGKRKQLFNFLTLEVRGQEVQFSVPRWVVVQRIEPEQFKASWDATRYVVDPATRVTDLSTATYDNEGNCTYTGDVVYDGDKLDKGPCPNEWFQSLWVIADHDGLCCKKAEEMSRSCWGYYRNPSQWDLNEIKRIHHAKLSDPTYNQSPFEPLTPETLEQTAKSEFERNEKVQAEKKAELDARIDQYFDVRVYSPATFIGDTVSLYKKTPAGIILPN